MTSPLADKVASVDDTGRCIEAAIATTFVQ